MNAFTVADCPGMPTERTLPLFRKRKSALGRRHDLALEDGEQSRDVGGTHRPHDRQTSHGADRVTAS